MSIGTFGGDSEGVLSPRENSSSGQGGSLPCVLLTHVHSPGHNGERKTRDHANLFSEGKGGLKLKTSCWGWRKSEGGKTTKHHAHCYKSEKKKRK